MSFSIKKSFLRANPGFEVQAAAHAHEVREWLERERRVAEDAKNPNVAEIERWVSCPAPQAPNSVVASAVDELGNVVFEIEDDDPPAEEVLRSKKKNLEMLLRSAEASARSSVMSQNKRPLHQIKVEEIAAADDVLRQQLVAGAEQSSMILVDAYEEKAARVRGENVGILAALAAKIGVSEHPVLKKLADLPKPQFPTVDFAEDVRAIRPPEDTALLDLNESMLAAEAAITRAVAVALSDIDDLTTETVDDYKIPDLTKQG